MSRVRLASLTGVANRVAAAVRRWPQAPEPYFNLGYAYQQNGEYSRAAERFKKAVEIKPDFARAYYSLGIVYLALGDKAAAQQQQKVLEGIDSALAAGLLSKIAGNSTAAGH